MTVDKNKTDLLHYIQDRAVKRGDFLLASGQRSSYYIDGKTVLCDPTGLSLVVNGIESVLQSRDIEVDAVGGPEIGAIYVATAVSLRSLTWSTPIPQITVRKQKKGHGAQKLVEGPPLPAGSRIAMVEDVVTTGGSMMKAIDAIEEKQWKVVIAFSIVDREAGAREALESRGIEYYPLVTITDLGLSNPKGTDSPLSTNS